MEEQTTRLGPRPSSIPDQKKEREKERELIELLDMKLDHK